MIDSLIKSKRIFIFDFDAVLVDSVEIKTKAFAYLYESYGTDVVKNVIKFHRENGGMSRYEKFRYFHNNFLQMDISKDEINRLSKNFSKFAVDAVVKANCISGSEDFLKKLLKKQLPTFVVSATPQKEIKEIIKRRNWAKYFNDIFGSPNTKSENINIILKNNSEITLKDCIFFGDALSDLDAAESHKIDFIGIQNDILDVFKDKVDSDFLIRDFSHLNKNF